MLSPSLFYVLVFHFALSFYLLGTATIFNIHIYNLSREPEGVFLKRTLPIFIAVIGVPMVVLLITTIYMVIAHSPPLFTHFSYILLSLIIALWVLNGFVVSPLFHERRSILKKDGYVQIKSCNLAGLICWVIECVLIMIMIFMFYR